MVNFLSDHECKTRQDTSLALTFMIILSDSQHISQWKAEAMSHALSPNDIKNPIAALMAYVLAMTSDQRHLTARAFRDTASMFHDVDVQGLMAHIAAVVDYLDTAEGTYLLEGAVDDADKPYDLDDYFRMLDRPDDASNDDIRDDEAGDGQS
jgi:hypothetical protein